MPNNKKITDILKMDKSIINEYTSIKPNGRNNKLIKDTRKSLTRKIVKNYYELKDIKEVAKQMKLTEGAVRKQLKRFVDNPYKLIKLPNNNVSELEPFEFEIANDIINHPITTIKQAQDRIKAVTGIIKSESAIRVFFKKHNFVKNKKGYYCHKDNAESNARKEKIKNSLINNKSDDADRKEKLKKAKIYSPALCDNMDKIVDYMNRIQPKEEEAIEYIKSKYPKVTDSDSTLKKFLYSETSVF